tara:strand:+ start:2778 stop:3029 length:252 start_codon:yes stop_codon:yes gene_type:complete
MNTEQNFQNGTEARNDGNTVLAVVFRPKNGHELLQALKQNKKCEIVDTHAFLAAKVLEDNQCGFCFSFKLSKWNKGWAGFERS